MNKKNNQKDAILRYLERNRGITQEEASHFLHVGRLAARVSDINKILLKNQDKIPVYGWERFRGRFIVADYEYVTNAYGQRTRIARYRLNVEE